MKLRVKAQISIGGDAKATMDLSFPQLNSKSLTADALYVFSPRDHTIKHCRSRDENK